MPEQLEHAYGSASGVVEANTRSVTIKINLNAIRKNLAVARRLSGGSKQFATIKADAYGHGAVAVAHALSMPASSAECADPDVKRDGCADGFAVVTLGEAVELRESGVKQPILVLQGPQTPDACTCMAQLALWPVVHDMQQYEWFRRCPERHELKPWLKVDTGMGRLGVQPLQAETILASDDGFGWQGLLTHFACADEVDNPYTQQQIDTFKQIASSRTVWRSLANSAAVLAWPQAMADWARPGIMLYGCNPLDRALPEGIELTPAMRVTAPIISVKQLSAGAGVGYAQTYQCPEEMPVGYVALGYRDGIPRVLHDGAAVTIRGHRCPIIGRVSMDSLAVDLRGISQVQPGQEVEFWGVDASIDELACAAGTISYELLTSIRGNRTYFE